ncbi:EamA family transporter [Actinokineospora cianjurensis]|uniref:Inner membrane transporter RhtA n=1 Tax=Actinokineospora cianjurensis TaxID=585224 RepID=A0A421B1T2_9PSEU|nr:EamA family transporter [Actinokineospora cianjurensis]RLK58302.1 inner membrane transporter RhtA [Actinokineospora cianjurensis]
MSRAPTPGAANPLVLVAVQMLSLQVGAAVAVGLMAHVGIVGAAFARVALACAVVGVLLRPRPRVADRRSLLLAAALGVVIAVMNTAYFGAVVHLGLGLATTIEFLGPFLVGLVSARQAADLLWSLVAAAGVVLIAGVGEVSGTGLALGLLAAGCRAGYIVLTRAVGDQFDGASGLFVALLVGTVVAAPFAVGTFPGFGDVGVLGLAAAVAVLSSAVPYLCDMASLRKLRTASFSVLLALSPAVSALAGLVLLGQGLSPPQWCGVGAVVLAGTASVLTTPRVEQTG